MDLKTHEIDSKSSQKRMCRECSVAGAGVPGARVTFLPYVLKFILVAPLRFSEETALWLFTVDFGFL